MTTCFLFQSLFCTRTQFKGSCNACICKHAALAATRFADESQGQSRRALLSAEAEAVSGPGGSAAPRLGCLQADVLIRGPPGVCVCVGGGELGNCCAWSSKVTARSEKRSPGKEKREEKKKKKKSQQKMCVTADYFRPWSMHNANKQLPGYMPVKTIQSHSTRL